MKSQSKGPSAGLGSEMGSHPGFRAEQGNDLPAWCVRTALGHSRRATELETAQGRGSSFYRRPHGHPGCDWLSQAGTQGA